MSFFSKMKALWRSLVFILFSNISFYEISHRAHRASRWCFRCFRCFRCNWFDIDWRNCSSSYMSNRSSMRWMTDTRIQCDDSAIRDRASVLPVGVASRILQGKYFLNVWEPEQVSRSEIHRFWRVASPLTERAKSIYFKNKGHLLFALFMRRETLFLHFFHIWENNFSSHLQTILQSPWSLFDSFIFLLTIISIKCHDSHSRNDSWLHEKHSYSVPSFLHSETHDHLCSTWFMNQWMTSQEALRITMRKFERTFKRKTSEGWQKKSFSKRLNIDQQSKSKSKRVKFQSGSRLQKRQQNESHSLQSIKWKSLNLSREWMQRRKLKQIESLALLQPARSGKQQNNCTRPFLSLERDGRMESFYS